jgi:hypothetical protein
MRFVGLEGRFKKKVATGNVCNKITLMKPPSNLDESLYSSCAWNPLLLVVASGGVGFMLHEA